MQSTRVPLGFGDQEIEVPSHACLFYYDDVELRGSLGFLVQALEDPEQAIVLFGQPERLEEVLGYLAAGRADQVDAARLAGRIVLVGGASEADALLGHIGATLDGLMERGVRLIRFLGFIAWDEEGWPTHEDLLRFEARVTDAARRYPVVVICAYDASRLPGPLLIFGGIHTHPLTIVGGVLCVNPHYVSADEYLARWAQGFPWNDEGRERLASVRLRKIERERPPVDALP